MASIFGGSSNPGTVAPAYTGVQLQTSSSQVCVPLVWGQARGAPNLIWYGDFQANAQHSSGKGAGPVTGYDYKASILMALAQGPIHGIGMVWVNSGNDVTLSQAGFTLVASGNTPQSPWSYLTSHFPSQALSYNGVALVAAVKMDLGSSPYPPSTAYEVFGRAWGTAPNGADADPAVIVNEYLSDAETFGVGIAAGLFGNLLSTSAAATTGDGTYQTYCRAMGFGLSPFLQNQEEALSVVDRWTKLTNTAVFWSGYALKFVPYGDSTVAANGVTYVPNLTPAYSLTDKDFVQQKNADPITCTRRDPDDCSNSVRLTINDRSMWYDPTPIELDDLALIQAYSDRPDSGVQASEVCDKVMAANMIALMLSRDAYIRNDFNFELPETFCLLEPMDVLEAFDPQLGTLLFRIIEFDEQDNGTFKVVAEQLTIGLSSPGATSTPQGVTSAPPYELVVPDPVNPPIIFEPPSTLAGTAQVWIAASGGAAGVADPNWGGANVWLSTDGATYSKIGTIEQPARQGVLTTNLAAYGGANPDTADTLAVSMAMSDGELISASAAAAANFATISWCGGELLAFETATLTGANAYSLTTLYRGLEGTSAGAHASGDAFVRLDNAIFAYDLPAAYIGLTLHIKLQSFNIFGYQAEDLSGVTAYTFTPTGIGFGAGTGGVPLPPTGLTASGVAGGVQIAWDANAASDNVTAYTLWRAPGIGASFGAASQIWTGDALRYTDNLLRVASGYAYFLEAVNDVGASGPSAGESATPGAVVDPSTTDVSARGSIPSSIPDQSFNYTATTTAVTITWSAFTVYRFDGTSIAVSSGSLAITGLAATTVYKVYPYMVDTGGTTGAVSFVSGGTGTGSPAAAYAGVGDAAAAATMSARGNIPLNGFQVATPGSGMAGGGGGGSSCLHPGALVPMIGRGLVAAGDIAVGDRVEAPGDGEILDIRRGRCRSWIVVSVDGEIGAVTVTSGHLFYGPDDAPIRARDLTLGTLLRTAGDHAVVTRLEWLDDDVDYVGVALAAPHLHYLGRARLLTHNGASKP